MNSSQPAKGQPSPALLFDTINAHQRTDAIKTAIELAVFTAIAGGNTSAADIAAACGASERGTRILCDFLVIIGFLTKENGQYGLTQDSAIFLDKNSPGYMGSVIDFMLSPMLVDNFKHLTEAVKKGGAAGETKPLEPEHPIWVKFAKAMAPMMGMASQQLAGLVDPNPSQPLKILDIAAGHGLFGLAFAKQNPQAEITAVDWSNVLGVATGNAAAAGVSERYHLNAGSAFDVDYGTGFDLVLLTNFLHHFDVPTCETLLRKVHHALKDGGRAVTLEFVPNDDRVSPPQAASFSMMMLGATPSGDAYTFAELERMFQHAGFAHSEMHELPPTIQRVVISHK
jgi:2-polyprenyl-3-methyl-5-hydroxy-6-metoxy-1,4-benzoquinol methylase